MISIYIIVSLCRHLLMKSRVPNSANSFVAMSERNFAYAGLINMFLENEENARAEESRTGIV